MQRATYLLMGGAVFWGADAAILLLGGVVPMRILIVGKTVILPALLVMAARKGARLPAGKCSILAKSYLMLAGIWLFGPVDLVLTNLLVEKMHMGPLEALFHVALFPVSTIVVALYSGALGGLIMTTVILCLFPFFCGQEPRA